MMNDMLILGRLICPDLALHYAVIPTTYNAIVRAHSKQRSHKSQLSRIIYIYCLETATLQVSGILVQGIALCEFHEHYHINHISYQKPINSKPS